MVNSIDAFENIDDWYLSLIDNIVGETTDADQSFSLMINKLNPKIYHICNGFFIAGYDSEDLYQESLMALRFKAIKDFKIKLDDGRASLSFENFACLCIKRHLSTLLKVSSKNKQMALNSAFSLDQSVPICDEDMTKTTFINFISQDVLSNDLSIEDKIDIGHLFDFLKDKLSEHERRVLFLYEKKFTYKEMRNLLIEFYQDSNKKKKLKIKSVDNAMTRIKQKAKKINEDLNII